MYHRNFSNWTWQKHWQVRDWLAFKDEELSSSSEKEAKEKHGKEKLPKEKEKKETRKTRKENVGKVWKGKKNEEEKFFFLN